MDQELEPLIAEYNDIDEYIPAEILLDDDHPAADKFTQDVREIQQKIFAFGRAMKPPQRELARLMRTEMKPPQIAKKVGKSLGWVYKHAKNREVIRLTVLMDHLQHKIDGPELDHRRGVLWRIVLDNEEKRPNISVQAMQEINKMNGTYAEAGNTGGMGNVVNIQINGETLPRGALDVRPDPYETRQQADGTFTPEGA